MSGIVDPTGSSAGNADGGGTVSDMFTTVPVDLFRAGNASGPRLDNIRDKDISITVVKVGGEDIRMVSPEGGLSTFGGYVQRPGVKWWKIPSGTKLPQSIRVVKDHYNKEMRAYHYSLQPARLMTLLEYAEGLKELALSAVPMFTQPITGASAASAHGEKESKVNTK